MRDGGVVSVIYHSPSRPLFYLHLDCQLFCKGAGSQGERREAGVCVCVRIQFRLVPGSGKHFIGFVTL